MKISVTVFKGDIYDIDVEPTDTVLVIKNKLQHILKGTNCSWQCLFHQGSVLKNDTRIDDIAITDGSLLFCIPARGLIYHNMMEPVSSTCLPGSITNSQLLELRSIKGSSAFFKISEVFLIDAAFTDKLPENIYQEQASDREMPDFSNTVVEGHHPNEGHTSESVEDLELRNQMAALGLPTSFTSTYKGKQSNVPTLRKSKKHQSKKTKYIEQNVGLPASNIQKVDTAVTEKCCLKFPCVSSELLAGDSNKLNDKLVTEPDVIYVMDHEVANEKNMQLTSQDHVDDLNSDLTLSATKETEIQLKNSKAGEAESFNGFEEQSKQVVLTSVQSWRDSPTTLLDGKENLEENNCEAIILKNESGTCDTHSGLLEKSEGFQNSIDVSLSSIVENPSFHESFERETQNPSIDHWTSFWDTYYNRYYYYNNKTHESSWDPPALNLQEDSCTIDKFKEYVNGDQNYCSNLEKQNLASDPLPIGYEPNTDEILECSSSSQVTTQKQLKETHSVQESRSVSQCLGLSAENAYLDIDGYKKQESRDAIHPLGLSAEIAYKNIDSYKEQVSGDHITILAIENVSCLEGSSQFSEASSGSKSEYTDSLESSLDDTVRCRLLSKACGTHSWFDDDGEMIETCSLEPESQCEDYPIANTCFQPCLQDSRKSKKVPKDIQAHGTHVWFDDEGEVIKRVHTNPVSPETNSQAVLQISIQEESDADEPWFRGNFENQEKEKRTELQRKPFLKKDGKRFKWTGLFTATEETGTDITKYWLQRYQLFSRYDEGVKLDAEGWFSVTPEVIAKHHARRSRLCSYGTVIDCFAGVGGNAIQFAQSGLHVLAVDIDQQRIDYADHNARIYGVSHSIDFIIGDFFQLAASLKADVAFLSPPWGGPDYLKVEKYDIMTMLMPKDGFTLFKIAQMIAPNIIMFLPRNVDLNQLAELSMLSDPPVAVEVEKNYINGKLKAVTAYFGDFVIPSCGV